jgi:Na+/H+-translocating membrane pyrophosphatase
MNSNEVKAQIHKAAKRVENGAEAVADNIGDGVDALAGQRDELLETFRDVGRRLLESSRALTEEAAKQARLRPLAVFGVAFVAGIVAARMLRR